VLYRSDAPRECDEIATQFDKWPLALVIDLRSDAELQRIDGHGYMWPDTTVVCRLPLLSEAAPDALSGALDRLYRKMIEDSAMQIATLVNSLANAATPALIHCAAGKDRTGVAVAVLLTAVGVVPEAILSDYQLTRERMPHVIDRLRIARPDMPAYADFPPHVLDTPMSAIDQALRLVESWPGGAEGWLAGHGATRQSIEELRLRLREAVAS
jgi:hypothetical protein